MTVVAGRSRGQGQSNERQINNLTQQCKQKFRTKQRRKIRADRRYIPSLKWIRDVDTTTTLSPSPCHKPTTRASNNKPSRRTAIQRKDDNTVRAHKRQCLKRGGRLGRQAVRARAYCRALGLSRNRRRVPCPVDAFARGRLHGHCPSTGRRARARAYVCAACGRAMYPRPPGRSGERVQSRQLPARGDLVAVSCDSVDCPRSLRVVFVLEAHQKDATAAMCEAVVGPRA